MQLTPPKYNQTQTKIRTPNLRLLIFSELSGLLNRYSKTIYISALTNSHKTAVQIFDKK